MSDDKILPFSVVGGKDTEEKVTEVDENAPPSTDSILEKVKEQNFGEVLVIALRDKEYMSVFHNLKGDMDVLWTVEQFKKFLIR